jgi:radical SAM protein with 4Fe4S-binding SPASM domain
VGELPAISQFCREHTSDYFRFDPMLHLRYDGNPERNEEIRSERLNPEQIVAIESADQEHFDALEKSCGSSILSEKTHIACDHVFHCGAGTTSFSVNYQGTFRLCSTLHHPDAIFDLRQISLKEAWARVPTVRDMRSRNQKFIRACRTCSIPNLCLGCAANTYLETGAMDDWIEYFCQVAHARADALQQAKTPAQFEQTANSLPG